MPYLEVNTLVLVCGFIRLQVPSKSWIHVAELLPCVGAEEPNLFGNGRLIAKHTDVLCKLPLKDQVVVPNGTVVAAWLGVRSEPTRVLWSQWQIASGVAFHVYTLLPRYIYLNPNNVPYRHFSNQGKGTPLLISPCISQWQICTSRTLSLCWQKSKPQHLAKHKAASPEEGRRVQNVTRSLWCLCNYSDDRKVGEHHFFSLLSSSAMKTFKAASRISFILGSMFSCSAHSMQS